MAYSGWLGLDDVDREKLLETPTVPAITLTRFWTDICPLVLYFYLFGWNVTNDSQLKTTLNYAFLEALLLRRYTGVVVASN